MKNTSIRAPLKCHNDNNVFRSEIFTLTERPRACTSPTTAHATSSSGVVSGGSQAIPLRPESADGTSPGTAAPAPTNPNRSSVGVRQVAKVKRFLVTLQQFGNDISPDVGDSVHHLIFALVVSNCHFLLHVIHSLVGRKQYFLD